MRSLKTLKILFILLILSIQVSAQSLALFDTKLNAEKMTLCHLINKYVGTKQDFKFVSFDSSFFSISSYDNNSSIFGHWFFVIRHDSLNQYGFTSLALPINLEWYKKLSKLTDSAIKVFTVKYGIPIKDTIVKKNFYQKGRKYFPGDIKKAMWLIDGQKLKVNFSIGGEHGQYSYQLRIKRFKDYLGNLKLPPWWDGY